MDLYDQKKENKSLTSIIFDKIREEIINGRFEPGEKLVEIKLADELGVSRTPVREALKQLELDGLVDNIPNRGVIVKGISAGDITDILAIRLSIERLVGKWACERITEEEVKNLCEIYDLMEFYTMKKDSDKIFELNTKFHEILYSSAKSRYLESILNDFQLFIKSARSRSLKEPGRLEIALSEHKKILDSIKSRDIEATENALVYHIQKSNSNIVKLKGID